MQITETVATAQKQTLELLTGFQGKIVEMNHELAGQISSLAPVTVPGFDKVWNKDLVDQAFTFTTDLLAAQQSFATGLIAAWTPTPKAAAKK